MRSTSPLRNPFWGLLVLAAVLFCVSVFAWLVAGFDKGDAPLKDFFRRNGSALTIGTAIATILFSGLAMTVDRLHTLRGERDRGRNATAGALRPRESAGQDTLSEP